MARTSHHQNCHGNEPKRQEFTDGLACVPVAVLNERP
jgi:hypothetical protein